MANGLELANPLSKSGYVELAQILALRTHKLLSH